MSFETLGLAPAISAAVIKAGYTDPTPVQAQAIPAAIAGHDLMVSSQTGSGKTAAFTLPSLNRLVADNESPLRRGGVRVLVLTPTRELALQVSAAVRTYGTGMRRLHVATVVGGMPYGAQLKALSRPVDVLVATPGRLLDHVQAGRVVLSQLEVLVLDEADRMLDMGFIEDIEAIVAETPASRQTLLFSATLDGNVARMAARMMKEPQRIEMASKHERHSNITQSLLYADDMAHKNRLLDHLLRDAALDQAIIFTATKRAADDLAGRLAEQGFSAAALHGDMTQRQRNRTITQLQRGNVQMLVATDVAARGIDVQGVSHVVNFDLPMQAEDYVHRIGRTGRAGRSGLAFTLATHSERHKVRRIEQYTGQSIAPQIVVGLEPQVTPRPSSPRRPGGGSGNGNWRGKPGSGPRGAGGPGKRFDGTQRSGGYASRDGERREYAPREGGQRDFAPRGDFAPRSNGPRGEYAPREGGQRDFAPRGDAGRRDFAPRGASQGEGQREWRPAGDRPAFAGKRGSWQDSRGGEQSPRAKRPAGAARPASRRPV